MDEHERNGPGKEEPRTAQVGKRSGKTQEAEAAGKAAKKVREENQKRGRAGDKRQNSESNREGWRARQVQEQMDNWTKRLRGKKTKKKAAVRGKERKKHLKKRTR